MNQKRRIVKRVFAGVLALVLSVTLLTVCFTNINSSGAAATSLPHIEEILNTQTTFHILEIVPEEGSGSLGYYVKGEEPFGDWKTTFANRTAYPDRVARVAYAGNLYTKLQNAGLLSTDTSTPLTYDTAYTESYFWELTDDDGTTSISGWSELSLPHTESASVIGTFTAQADGNYNVENGYELSETGEGDYVQIIPSFTYTTDTSQKTGVYYYNPSFSLITLDMNLSTIYGQAAYTKEYALFGIVDEDTVLNENVTYYEKIGDDYVVIDPDAAPIIDTKLYIETYKFFDTIDTDTEFDSDVDYYYVTDTGTPKASLDEQDKGIYNYSSNSTTFTAVSADSEKPGYFNQTILGYHYVTGNKGAYTFTPDPDGETHTVFTDVAYYQGTITNNQWFLSNVFDVADTSTSKISISVDTVTPSSVDINKINNYDLIVLSGGFDLSNPSASLAESYNNTNNDLTGTLAYSIYYAALKENCPLIVDYRLTGLTNCPNITRLAQLSLMSDSITEDDFNIITEDYSNFLTYSYTWAPPTQTNYVSGSVYCFNPPFTCSGSSTALALATNCFKTAFSTDVISNGFSDVLTEIKNENFLRKTDDPNTADLLTEQVTMANSIRYIINYADRRITTAKTSIKVLDLEPGRVVSDGLTKDMVLKWLGANTTFTANDITIATMTTAEFIGKIEDINETYDLVYMGTCIDGFNKDTDGKTDYNDGNMDGLIYSNIGDFYRSSTSMAGLLARDFDNSDPGKSNLFRFSGNDITAAKEQALMNFANAGYPVVISNEFFESSTTTRENSFNVDIATSRSGGTVTLTATAVDAGTSSKISATYQWYYKTSITGTATQAGTSQTCSYSPGNNTTRYYYCIATANGTQTATSNVITVTKKTSNSSITMTPASPSSAISGKYHIFDSNGDINTNRVDSNSYVYKAISAIKNRDNVMSVSEIDASTLLSYLNLSKPQIVFTDPSDPSTYPVVYSSDDDGMTSMASKNGSYYLEYTFSIKNDTDPTPATTTYDCRLYIDLNADGRYADSEMLDDIKITKGGVVINPVIDANGNEYYKLTAGVEYYVTRELPSDYVGILPWKLMVVKNGAEKIHASAHNYTRIQPTESQKKTIHILQIAPSSTYSTSYLNLENQLNTTTKPSNDDVAKALQAKNGNYYTGIYGKLLADVSDFSVDIDTVPANIVETWGSTSDEIYHEMTTERTESNAGLNKHPAYDMLIIGFADMYQSIGSNTAYAITQFIQSGKSILFTHDTTSYYNTNTGWGYYFNTVIRDAVGLDRYGITSKVTLGTTSTTIKSLLYAENDNTNLTSSNIAIIENNGYSVAYKPKSITDTPETLAETQGFTSYTLMRYRQGTYLEYTNWDKYVTSSISSTTNVSQINEGQITTYPYNVNTTEFDASSPYKDYFYIALTHEQYYQLNLNGDDVVVWYCLATGDSDDSKAFNDIPNDCINAYYIYNKGNVTYSGMGHSAKNSEYTTNAKKDSVYYNEAKLFVNTMIASYQSGIQKPTVSIKDSANGDNDLKYLYASSNTSSVGNSGEIINSTMPVYFKISDTNLAENKAISLSFFYESGDYDSNDTNYGASFTPIVYQSDGVTTATTLKGGTVYMINLPTDVLALMNSSDVSSVNITVKVTTTIGTASLSSTDSVELRKIDLFNLR